MSRYRGLLTSLGVSEVFLQQVDSTEWREARSAAVQGKIAPLRLLIVDVQMAPKDAKKRYCRKTPFVSVVSTMHFLPAMLAVLLSLSLEASQCIDLP